MKTPAAILVQTSQPLELVDLEIPALKPGQALIEIAYSGVCHTQVLEARGHRGPDKFLPHALGHEGSGTVREVAPNVTKVKPGDPVVLSWIKGSGADVPGTTYQWAGKTVNSGAITTFSQFSVISENRLTRLPTAVDPRLAALLGCAVPTGLGSVFNVAQPKPGQSLAVFGIGGVGACALLGAAVAGCVPLIAIDIADHKLDLAKKLGATHTLHAKNQDVAAELSKLIPGGLDFAIEATGQPAIMRQALQSVRGRGGAAVIIGNARHGQALELDPWQFNLGKRLLGSWGGECQPDHDFPRFANLLQHGRLNLAPLLSPDYSLPQINQALDDLEAGKVVRPIIQM